MKADLIAALETICPGNVFLQGTIAEDVVYPESFITFWVDTSNNDGAYNNSEFAVDWYITVNFYSCDPALVESKPPLIRTALKNAGFMPQGRGSDLPSDVETHTGWTMNFIKREYV